MEILIILVGAIVSILLRGKKPGEAPKTQKRQPNTQSDSSDPMRKLKEMTQEMYKEIQREFQTEVEEPPSRQSSEPKPVSAVPSPGKGEETKRRDSAREFPVHAEKKQERSSKREPHRGRLSAHQGSLVAEVQVEHTELIPRTEQDLIKGIIFSEILGPPKSKQ